jgi:nucleolar protein 12
MRFRSVAFQRPMSATPAPRTHDLERTAEWRATKGDEVSTPRPRLSSGDKKRIAFIQHELHVDAASVTVYVVFAHGADLAPDEAAKSAAAALDNTQYLGRTLRADTAGGGIGDPKRTIFVGSLDFAAREEDLREFFEGVVSAERGPRSVVPGDDSDSDDEEDVGEPNAALGAKPKTWVTRVRIVRDKDTQLGKGFAYVQFAVRVVFFLAIPGDAD